MKNIGSLNIVNSSEIEEDSQESVETTDNNIYFYCDVTRQSVLELNKKLKALHNSAITTGINLNIATPLTRLHINSHGGSLLDGFAAVDAIRDSNVVSIVEGSAASAATLMSVVASKRLITKHSFMLIHQLSGAMWGKFEDMKDDMQNCNMFMDTVYDIYGTYAKIPKNILKDILKRDIYFDAKTCLKYGLVDEIIL